MGGDAEGDARRQQDAPSGEGIDELERVGPGLRTQR